MTNKENPYCAPQSSFAGTAEGPAWILSEAQQGVFANTIRLARHSALAFLAYACVVPFYSWFQAHTLLRNYGAEQHVDIVLLGLLEREGPWTIGLVLMAMLALKACRTIRRGDTDGPRQLAIACAGTIALDVLANALELSSWPPAIALRCAWCVYLLHSVLKATKAANAAGAMERANSSAGLDEPSGPAAEIRPPAP